MAGRWEEAVDLTTEVKGDARADLSAEVYQACAKIFEALEAKRFIYGNGHHMAQKVSEFATELLKERWVDNKKPREGALPDNEKDWP